MLSPGHNRPACHILLPFPPGIFSLSWPETHRLHSHISCRAIPRTWMLPPGVKPAINSCCGSPQRSLHWAPCATASRSCQRCCDSHPQRVALPSLTLMPLGFCVAPAVISCLLAPCLSSLLMVLPFLPSFPYHITGTSLLLAQWFHILIHPQHVKAGKTQRFNYKEVRSIPGCRRHCHPTGR